MISNRWQSRSSKLTTYIELYRKILDLQGEAMELVEENSGLKKEIESVKEKLQLKESLKFERNAYWTDGAGGKDGPFCSKCWDVEKLLVRMLSTSDPGYVECPKCKVPLVGGA